MTKMTPDTLRELIRSVTFANSPSQVEGILCANAWASDLKTKAEAIAIIKDALENYDIEPNGAKWIRSAEAFIAAAES